MDADALRRHEARERRSGARALACHIQIPKTGTNTVRSLLEESLPQERMLAFKVPEREIEGDVVTWETPRLDIADFREALIRRQWALDLASMMLPVGAHDWLERPVEYFSFMRDPVARCVSAVNFVRNMGEKHVDAKEYAAANWSVGRIVRAGNVFYHNDQVRLMSGTSKRVPDRSDLELARRNILTRFFWVGITEDFAASWSAIAGHFGFASDPGRRRNASDYAAGIRVTDEDREAVKHANQLDVELYEWLRDDYLPLRFEHRESARTA